MTAGGPRHTLLVAIVVLANAGLLFHSTYAGSGDEPHYLAIAHSIAFDFDLDLGNNYGPAEPLIAGGGLQPEAHVRPGVNGIARPVHDVGMPLLFAPYVRLARPFVEAVAPRIPPSIARRLRLTPTIFYRNLIALAMLAIAAGLACLTMDVCVGMGCRRTVAFWTTALAAVSPPLSVHSVLFFTEIPVATVSLAAFWIVMRSPDRRSWAIAGALTGALMLLHARSLGLCIGLSAVALVRACRGRAFAAAGIFVCSAIAVVAIRIAILHHMWGTWMTSPIARPGDWGGLGAQVHGVLTRATGLLVDQEFGLLIYAPLFVLALPGFVYLARRRVDTTLAMGVICSCYLGLVLLPLTNPWGWMGGWSPPARFLVPILPFVVVAIASAVERLPRAVLIPVFVLQLAIDAFVWQTPKILWNDGDGTAAFCARGGARVCAYLPSIPR